jgi:hypothetical protein
MFGSSYQVVGNDALATRPEDINGSISTGAEVPLPHLSTLS